MNRTTLIVLVLLTLSIAAVAIWYFAFRTPVPVETREPNTPVVPAGTIDDHGAYHDIDASYPTAVPTASGSEAAKARMEAFVRSEATTFKRESIDTLRPEDIEFLELGGERKYALGITYDTYTSAKTISYVFTIYANTMGAHPNTYYRTFMFDKETGKELTLADLFISGTEYLQQLSDRTRQTLVTKMAEMSQIDESDVDTEYLYSGTEPRTENFQWFYISGDTLVLLFPPYQVGPYALGAQEVRLEANTLTESATPYLR